jgi:hypothetical protein
MYQCGDVGMIDLSPEALDIIQGLVRDYLRQGEDTELENFANEIRAWLQHQPKPAANNMDLA